MMLGEMLWCDLIGFSTCYNYLHYYEYPKLSDILANRLSAEEDRETTQTRSQDYENAKMRLISTYRSKFYTDSQYWH